ncbi:MAG: hypothetical protein JW818_12545 [Pirellulales bacterium]|nr:hypothetical protein [Pirellulales bacterium]
MEEQATGKKANEAKWPKRLPEVTPLQFFVIGLLLQGEKTVPEIRRELNRLNVTGSSGALSRLMKRLCHRAYVCYRSEKGWIGKTPVERRVYCVSNLGLVVWRATRRFYAQFPLPVANLVPEDVIEAELMHLPPNERSAAVPGYVIDEFVERFIEANRRGLPIPFARK